MLRVFGRVALFTITACCILSWQLSAQENTNITGKVTYRDGAPVSGATVAVMPFGGIGILPRPVRTNSDGTFIYKYPALGEGWISASKPDEGYPDEVFGFYNVKGSTSYKKIELKRSEVSVSLQLGKPRSFLTLTLVDADTARFAGICTIRLRAGEASTDYFAEEILNGQSIVLPDRAVTMRLECVGYQDWPSPANINESRLDVHGVQHLEKTIRLLKK